MNPIISSQQAHFYKQNGYIEFEAIFSATECTTLQDQLQTILFSRLKRKLRHIPAKELYENGRDLWREHNSLKSTLLARRMTSIALGLVNKHQLRLGCDQWIEAGCEWTKQVKLNTLIGLQNIACGFLIRMTDPQKEEPVQPTFLQEIGLIPLPAQRGNALIVAPQLLLNFPKLAIFSPTNLYLVVYTHTNAVYIHSTTDPLNKQLKSMGYNFGDTLNNQSHPLIMNS